MTKPGSGQTSNDAHLSHQGVTLRARLEATLGDVTENRPSAPAIPDHTLLRRIGKGSFGEVWIARNTLGTLRAVKIVYRAWFDEDRPYEREFDGILNYEPISRTHDGLMQILHVGRSDESECFFYVMELADAEESIAPPRTDDTTEQNNFVASYRPHTLRSVVAARQHLSAIDAAKIGLHLCRAVGHLHQHGLVHRDIKPSNIIFVNGRPKLADIGLVADVGSSKSYVGTEGFIPPEGPGSPEADLYALGKLLYELSTGRDRMDFPDLPADVSRFENAENFFELNEVITRACAPETAARYRTASAFEADLNLIIAGRSLRRARNVEHYISLIKRLSAAASVLFAVMAIALWLSRRDEQRAEERVQVEIALRHRAEEAERERRHQVYAALLEQARANVRSREEGHRVKTLEAIRKAVAISNSVELRREVFAALALPDLRFDRELYRQPQLTVRSLDRNFERIAVGQGRGPIEIRRVKDESLLATLPASANLPAYVVSWRPDGKFLAVKRDRDLPGFEHDLELWNLDQVRQIIVVTNSVWNSRTFHPSRPWLLTGGQEGTLTVWNLEDGSEVARGKLEAAPENLAYSPEGNRVAACYQFTNSWFLTISSAPGGETLHKIGLTNRPAAIEWHPKGRWVAVTDHGGQVLLVDSTDGASRLLGRHKAEAATAAFTPEGEYLFTGGWEREILCWDMRTMQRVMNIGRDSYIAQFRADGRACALITDQTSELHFFETPRAVRNFEEDLGPRMRHATFSPDSRTLAASGDKRGAVWNITTNGAGKIVDSLLNARLAWSSNGKQLFSGAYGERGVQLKISADAAELEVKVNQLELQNPANFQSVSLHSNHVVWTGPQGTAIAALENPLPEPASWKRTAPGINDISPDGRFLGIYESYGRIFHVYRLPEVQLIAQLTTQGLIAGFSFSPNNAEVAVASRGQVEFWDTTSWQRTRVATNFIGLPTMGIIYHPGTEHAWMARDLRTAALVNTKTFEPEFYLPTGVLPLAVSPNGKYLAVSVDLHRLQLWELDLIRDEFQALGINVLAK